VEAVQYDNWSHQKHNNLMFFWYSFLKICVFYFTYIIRTLATGPLFVVKIVRTVFKFLR